MLKKSILSILVICVIILCLSFEKDSKRATDFFSEPSASTNDCTKRYGVLDRIEDKEQAVIMIEQLNEQWIVDKNELPDNSKVDMWFTIDYCVDTIEVISIDPKKTKLEMKRSSELINQLRLKVERNKGRSP